MALKPIKAELGSATTFPKHSSMYSFLQFSCIKQHWSYWMLSCGGEYRRAKRVREIHVENVCRWMEGREILLEYLHPSPPWPTSIHSPVFSPTTFQHDFWKFLLSPAPLSCLLWLTCSSGLPTLMDLLWVSRFWCLSHMLVATQAKLKGLYYSDIGPTFFWKLGV